MNRLLIFCQALLALCCCVLSSCCAVFSTGAALDAVGRQTPDIQLTKQDETSRFSPDYTPEAPTIWKKGELYYVELPVVYGPMRESWFFYCYSPGHCVEYPSALSASEQFARQSEAENYYAELNAKQLDMALAPLRKFERSPLADENFRMLKAGEVDLTGAQKLPCAHSRIYYRKHYFLRHLPDKRTVGNQLRRPLAWSLYVVDVPLTLGASAIGWGQNLICWPFLCL